MRSTWTRSPGWRRTAAQAQRIGHDADRAQGHAGGRHHRIQQETVHRIQDARGDRDGQHVVEKSPEQILPDHPARLLGKPDQLGHFPQVGRDHRRHRRMDGQVASPAHRDAQVGPRQRSAVVDAVTDHGHLVPFFLQTADIFLLLQRKDTGMDRPDAGFRGHPFRRRSIVAGQQHRPDALLMQEGNGFG